MPVAWAGGCPMAHVIEIIGPPPDEDPAEQTVKENGETTSSRFNPNTVRDVK